MKKIIPFNYFILRKMMKPLKHLLRVKVSKDITEEKEQCKEKIQKDRG